MKEFEFNIADNENWGLKVFQDNYQIRKTKSHKYSSSIKIKTTCLAITPSGLENVRTHAAGIWKIETE